MYGSGEPAKALANVAELGDDALVLLKDFTRHLADAAVARAFRDLLDAFAAPGRLSALVLVDSGAVLPPELAPHVARLELGAPTAGEYRHVVAAVAEAVTVAGHAGVDLAPDDHEALAGALQGLTLPQARRAVARVAVEDGVLARDDLGRLLDLKAAAIERDGLLEHVPATAGAAELGGFAGLRAWLDRAALARSPQAAALNVPAPKGILLAGVQGCGKSLAARHVARAWRLPLLKLDPARLYDRYVGETERNLRRAIAAAEALAPCVLWIDELEKALTPGGSNGDGGVSTRLFGSFVTWLQEKRADVFVVATANDVSVLPPSCCARAVSTSCSSSTCPPPPSATPSCASTCGAATRIRRRSTSLPWPRPRDGFSGAELEQAVIAGALRALAAGQPLATAHVAVELAATVPLSRSRAEDVARLRAWAAGRFVPAA